MIQAVFFDFDGVICNTEPIFFEFKLKEMAKLGYPVKKEFLLKHVGESFRVMFPREFHADDPDSIIESYYTDMEHLSIDLKELMYPDLIELLDYCKSQNLTCAITSNSKQERLVKAVQTLNIKEYFCQLYSNERLGVAKPDPLFYKKVLDDLHLNPYDAIVIEDSAHGIYAAKGAGIYTIAKKETYFGIDQSKADIQVDHLSEVIGILKTLNHS